VATIPKEFQGDSGFARDAKLFFNGEASETQSNYDRAAQKFFADAGSNGRVNPQKALGGKF